MKYSVAFLVLLALLCTLTFAATPSSVNVFLSPNQPVLETADHSTNVLYIRISGEVINDTYTVVDYYKSISISLNLPTSIKGKEAAVSKCELNDGKEITFTHSYTEAEDQESFPKLTLTTQLTDAIKTDHLRIFCYGLPVSTDVYETHTVEQALTISYANKEDAPVADVKLSVVFQEIAQVGFTPLPLLSFDVNTSGVKTADVEKTRENLEMFTIDKGMSVSVFKVTPGSDKTTISLGLVAPVDQDIIEQNMTLVKDQLLPLLKTGGATASNTSISVKKIPYTCVAGEDGTKTCGGDCAPCEEGHVCTDDAECIYSSCVEGKCANQNSSFAISSMSVLFVVSIALAFLF